MGRLQNKFGLSIVGALLLLVIAALAGGAFAGPLDPPAPPGSTQQTQITSLPYTISASGSYILTGNLTGAGGSDGITVTAPDVTIDMSGFALVGPGGAGTESGIVATGGTYRVSVRNGIIREWGGFGLEASGGEGGEFSNLTFDHDGFNGGGIGVLASNASISDCVVENSGSSSGVGLDAVGLDTVTGCQFSDNPGVGLELQSSTATNVSAVANGYGIDMAGESTLADSTATANTKDGVLVPYSGNTITRTTADLNGGNGINVTSDGNTIDSNTVYGNTGADPSGMGVKNTGTGNTISNNTANGNKNIGIFSTGDRALISGNHASGDLTSVGNCGEIVVQGSGAVVEDNVVQNSSAPATCLINLAGTAITAVRNSSRSGTVSKDYLTSFCTTCDIAPITTAAAMTSPVGNIAE